MGDFGEEIAIDSEECCGCSDSSMVEVLDSKNTCFLWAAGLKSANRLSVGLLAPNRGAYFSQISQVQSTMICAKASMEIYECPFVNPYSHAKFRVVDLKIRFADLIVSPEHFI